MHHARSILAAAAVVCSLGLALPVTLPHAQSSIPDAACLSLSESTELDAIATDVVERCSALYPDDVDLLVIAGDRYQRAGEAGRAERAYRRALALEPDYADVRLRLGRLLLARGARGEAAHEARVALETQPNRRALVELARQAAGPAAR